MPALNPALTLGPIGAGAVLTGGYYAMNRLLRRRSRNDKTEGEKELEAFTSFTLLLDQLEDEALIRSEGDGQIAVIGVGNFATSIVSLMLDGTVRASADGHFGAGYIIQGDIQQLDVCLKQVDQLFAGRITAANLRSTGGGGLIGRDLSRALQLKEKWGYDIEQGALRFLQILKAGAKPAILLVLVSSGGSKVYARSAIECFREVYEDVPILMVALLDEKSIPRERITELLDYCSYDNLVTRFLVLDNRRQRKAADLGLPLLIPGLAVAPWLKPDSVDLWNICEYCFPMNGNEEPRFATISVAPEMLPVRPEIPRRGVLPARYFTDKTIFEDVAMRCVKRAVHDERRQSLPLPRATHGATSVALVCAPVKPIQFQESIERIDAGIDTWRLKESCDIQIAYADIKAPLFPADRETPLVVVYLQPLDATIEDIDGIARGTTPIDPRFLPKPEWQSAKQLLEDKQ